MVNGPDCRGLSPSHSMGTLLRWRCDQRGITGAGFDLSGGSTVSLVPVRDDGRGGLAHRHGPVPDVATTDFSCSWYYGRGRVRCDLDVQRQAFAFADWCAGHRLRLLHLAPETAFLAGVDRHFVRECSRGGNRHWLAKQRQL